MKKTLFFLFFLFELLSISNNIYACEINVTSDKEIYLIDEIATLNVEIKNTHRVCKFSGVEPKITVDGLEVTAKTKYKEKSAGLWAMKVKVKLKNIKNKFTALRDNCPQGGGRKTIEINVKGAL